jgi:aminopeptidase-like protein
MHGGVRSPNFGKPDARPTDIQLSVDDEGRSMHRFISELYPICRSITGDGVRKTLNLILEHIPLTICEVPSGLRVFDWTVPLEWNIRDAYVKNSAGERVIDFCASNLHVVGYSVPVRARLGLSELKEHLFSDPEQPDWIPYRTSYYKPTWGFCLPHNQLLALPEDDYEVRIDSSLEPGHLTYGEFLLRGRSPDEVLISCHVCHPSLCNDNLSGIAVATALAKRLESMDLRYSYRFLFIPGTIGSITWAAIRQSHLSRIKHGFVLTCVGDGGSPTYKLSRRGNAEIDNAWTYVLKQSGAAFDIQPFSPFGYDERQYCSPGLNLPVGCFMRTPHGQFPEYHTSADDIDLVCAGSLGDSLAKALTTIDVIEHNRKYLNLKPFCEPKLGDYGLYSTIGGFAAGEFQMALLWLLNMSDGENSVLDIATRANLPWATIKQALGALCKAGLLQPVDPMESAQ